VVQVDPATLDKTRESWGKPADPKPLLPPEPKKVTDLPKPPVPVKPVADLPKPPPPKPVETKPAPVLPPLVLPHADTTKPDPLLSDPTKFARKPVEEKLAPKGDLPPALPPKPAETASNPPAVPAAPLPSSSESLGVGSKSIVDSGAVNYTPQPILTLPPASMGPPPRPPQTPQWQVPQAPQPINPARGNALESNQGGIPYNAFLPREFTPPKPGTPEQGMMANAFSSDTDPVRRPSPMVYGPPVGGVFGPPRPPLPPQPTMGGYGPPPHNPMLPPAPYGPTVQLAPPAGEHGPASQGTQVAMLPPQDRGVMPVGYQAPAATTVPQLSATLRDALFPSQREAAAEKLATLDWKTNDDAVRALVQAVHDDPAPTVRAACIHALAKMKVNTMPVVGAIRNANNDKDVRVRTEADDALSVLAAEK